MLTYFLLVFYQFDFVLHFAISWKYGWRQGQNSSANANSTALSLSLSICIYKYICKCILYITCIHLCACTQIRVLYIYECSSKLVLPKLMKGKKKEVKKETGLGLCAKKDDNFGEWYSEVCLEFFRSCANI